MEELTIGKVVNSSEFEKMVADASKDKFKLSQVHECIALSKQVLEELVSKGVKVMFPGFISFVPSYKPEHSGMNSFTNEPYTSPEKAVIAIKPGSKLKEAALKITGENLQKLKALKK